MNDKPRDATHGDLPISVLKAVEAADMKHTNGRALSASRYEVIYYAIRDALGVSETRATEPVGDVEQQARDMERLGHADVAYTLRVLMRANLDQAKWLGEQSEDIAKLKATPSAIATKNAAAPESGESRSTLERAQSGQVAGNDAAITGKRGDSSVSRPDTAVAAPHDKLDEIKAMLQRACDRDWKDESLYQTAVIAANAVHWRGKRIEELKETLSATRSNVAEECAKICEARAVAWDASVREGSEQRGYEETVLMECAAAIRREYVHSSSTKEQS